MRAVVLMAVLGLCVAVAAWAAGPPKSPFRPTAQTKRAPAPAKRVPPVASKAITPAMSPEGLEGMREVYVDVQVSGEAKFMASVGMDQKKLKSEVEARLRRAGATPVKERSVIVPRLLVQVMGHAIPRYDEADPPAAAHMTIALIQPVLLARRSPSGQFLQSYGTTYQATVFSTGRMSSMQERVKQKVESLLKEFEDSYRRANPKPAK